MACCSWRISPCRGDADTIAARTSRTRLGSRLLNLDTSSESEYAVTPTTPAIPITTMADARERGMTFDSTRTSGARATLASTPTSTGANTPWA